MSVKENEVMGETTGKIYEVVSVKMKHLKNNFYGNYMFLKEHGLMKLCTFKDGADIVNNILTAVFNSEEIAKELIEGDDLDANMMSEIIKKTKELNGIEDESAPEITPSQE